MLLILICFSSICFSSEDCYSYYKETLMEKSIDGIVEEKEEVENYFVIRIKQGNSDDYIEINLLKNKKSLDLYEFSKKGSYIKKRKGVLNFTIMTPNGDGGYQGKRFEGLCK